MYKQCQAHEVIGNHKINTNPCMHFKWTDKGHLIIWTSWVNDIGRGSQKLTVIDND